MGTRILLAGGESEFLMNTLKECKARFILVSYYYISHKWRGSLSELRDYFKNFEFVLMDSGAFTLFSKPGLTYEEVIRYANKYAEFLEEMKDSISAAVELDLYEIPSVGLKSHDIRTEILEKSGVPIVPVYHGDAIPINKQYREDMEEFCKRYKYVGVASGMVLKGMSHVTSMVSIAKKYGAVVHGFGITRQDYIRQSRFFTCDSTAWTNGQRFGTTYVFEQNKLRIYDNKRKQSARNRHRARWIREGFDLTGLENDATEPFTKLNCHEWCRFQEYVYQASNRDYWEPDLEVNPFRKGKEIIVPTRLRIDLDGEEPEEGEMLEDLFKDEESVEEDSVIEAEAVIEEEESLPAVIEDSASSEENLVVIRKFDDYWNGKIQEGKKFVFFQRDIKKQWTSTFQRTDYGWLETSTSRFQGEGTVLKKIYKELNDKIDQLDLEYNNHLRHHYLRNNIKGKEYVDAGVPAVRVEGGETTIAKAIEQLVKCDDCYLGERCRAFSAGRECAYSVPISLNQASDIMEHVQKITGIQFERVYKGALIEKLDGGVLDKTVSEEIMRAMSLVKQLKDLAAPPETTVKIEARGEAGAGALAKLFASKGGKGGE